MLLLLFFFFFLPQLVISKPLYTPPPTLLSSPSSSSAPYQLPQPPHDRPLISFALLQASIRPHCLPGLTTASVSAPPLVHEPPTPVSSRQVPRKGNRFATLRCTSQNGPCFFCYNTGRSLGGRAFRTMGYVTTRK